MNQTYTIRDINFDRSIQIVGLEAAYAAAKSRGFQAVITDAAGNKVGTYCPVLGLQKGARGHVY
jgi:hypothetical protein